jgi:hypothetical protein
MLEHGFEHVFQWSKAYRLAGREGSRLGVEIVPKFLR